MNHRVSNLISSVMHRINVMARYGKHEEQFNLMSDDEYVMLRGIIHDIDEAMVHYKRPSPSKRMRDDPPNSSKML